MNLWNNELPPKVTQSYLLVSKKKSKKFFTLQVQKANPSVVRWPFWSLLSSGSGFSYVSHPTLSCDPPHAAGAEIHPKVRLACFRLNHKSEGSPGHHTLPSNSEDEAIIGQKLKWFLWGVSYQSTKKKAGAKYLPSPKQQQLVRCNFPARGVADEQARACEITPAAATTPVRGWTSLQPALSSFTHIHPTNGPQGSADRKTVTSHHTKGSLMPKAISS